MPCNKVARLELRRGEVAVLFLVEDLVYVLLWAFFFFLFSWLFVKLAAYAKLTG